MRTKPDSWTSLPPPPPPPPALSLSSQHSQHSTFRRKGSKLRLDLYNFDGPKADDCPYVLTSPRSLEACRRTGLKPVDLLPTTIAQLERELIGVTPEQLFKIFVERERFRLANLERCRLAREEIIKSRGSFGKIPLRENSFATHLGVLAPASHSPSSSIELSENSKEFASRKEKLDKENKARTLKKAESTEECTKDKTQEDQDVYSVCTSRAASATHDNGQTFQRGQSAGSSSLNSRRKKRRGSSGSQRGSSSCLRTPPPAKKVTPTRPQSCGKKGCDSSASGSRSGRSTAVSRIDLHAAPIEASITESSSINATATSPCSFVRSSRNSARERRVCSHQDLSNYNSGSTGSLTRRKQVSFRGCHASLEDIWPWVPERDRRILQFMALRREDQREREEMAHRHHLMWEAEVEKRKQELAEEEKRWKEWVGEKRKRESEENAKRWEEVRKSLMASQHQLQESIDLREQRCLKAKAEIEQRKKIELEDKSLTEARKAAVAQAARCQMAEEEMMWQQHIEEELQEKLKRAESTKASRTEGVRRRVASANRAEELRHLERWRQLREEEEEELERVRMETKIREEKADNAYRRISLEKEQMIKEQSLERSIKADRCRQLNKELEDGLVAWRTQVVLLQEAATEKAVKEVTRRKEARRQHIVEELNTRRERHNILMSRICAEEEARNRWVRESIKRKEERMRRLCEERGAAVGEARERARATALLRDSLRRALSPDTFDRRAARVALEARMDPSRPPTASPTMNRSHIHLG
ncbi:coiled-coil domain-containing protein 177-like isoform X2 [Hetaerina americana]|uniref:coiled-coil domain-containing protein 177-like isoform X2 n=1 Tax=Hetaerina americana TaxID=62018 RepID=UPI003A7F2322